jgi:pimeloyl-ACP methyl ester carboxylesterase
VFTPFYRGGSGPALVCLHGFLDTWRTWDLVLSALSRRHDVLAPTLPGHAGATSTVGETGVAGIVAAVEHAMDEAGFGTANVVGNSLGGYVALQLAARGRAETVVALAPAGGWAAGDVSAEETLHRQALRQDLLRAVASQADSIAGSPAGRRQATELITVRFEHIPAELIAHLLVGAALCTDAAPLVETGLRDGWDVDAERITCPVRIVWGTEDRLLDWPAAAARYLDDWLPHADWVVLEGVGHCPQLDVPLESAELILGFTGG